MTTKNLAVIAPRNTQVSPTEALSKMSPQDLATIKATVAKGATDNELAMFLTLAASYNLDPFLKEIWCIKQNITDAALIMTSRDGYLKIANSHPDFLGIRSFVVKEGDTFEVDAEADTVVHKFGAKRGLIVGAWAACYRKGRKPAICFVDYSEYRGNSPTWQKYPSAMIQKVSETFVLKRQFGISGLVTTEEIDEDVPEPKMINVTNTQVEVTGKAETASPPPEQPIVVDGEVIVKDEVVLESEAVQWTKNGAVTYTILGLRPSPAVKTYYEMVLANKDGEKIMVFVKPESVVSILEELKPHDVITAEFQIENGINILTQYGKAEPTPTEAPAPEKAPENEAKKEQPVTPRQRKQSAPKADGKQEEPVVYEFTGQILSFGWLDPAKQNAIGAKLSDGQNELLVVSRDPEMIKSVSEKLTVAQAGPGSTVKVGYKQVDKFNIFKAFEVLDAKKVVGQ